MATHVAIDNVPTLTEQSQQRPPLPTLRELDSTTSSRSTEQADSMNIQRSSFEKFIDSFLQEKNIRWMLLIGAAIVFMPLSEARNKLVENFERVAIERALELDQGNISAAARRLGIHRQSLQQKLKQLEED